VRKILFWCLFAVTLAVYAVMLTWSLPTVSAAAGGLPPFDMRPGGYSFDEAKQFLAALSPDGAAFYRDVQHKLDIGYPVLNALTLFFAVAALLPSRLGGWRYLIAAPALSIAILDYLENGAVDLMLAAGAGGLTADLVATASTWTQWKSGVTTVVMTVVLVLLIWRGIAALLSRRRASSAA
jgi:hypothetical protein